MRSLVFALGMAAAVAATVFAQEARQASMAAWLRGAYMNNRNYIARAAEMMPENLYGMRPGAQTEVRTFGQIIGHLANFNFLWCSQARGEKNPNAGNDFEKVTSKAALV